MPRRLWITLLSVWPGLPQIWSGQELLGLILAVLFAATLNLALVTGCLWTDALPQGFSTFFLALTVLSWATSLGYTLWWVWRCHPERYKTDIDRLYREAVECYLQGRWNDARRRFEQVLAMDETDADALMQLGMLYVRTDQPVQARRTFRQCLELEGGTKWRWEIGQAMTRLGND
ncbi:MAG: tetratricopeptide repeat protein [Isosphaeraceae bacterium]